MAINYVISYTFSPSTTISSSQVNQNFSDNANTWTGLEALTKSFAKLKIDVDPATALEVATKQYVDHYSTYRRPVLQYSSSTVVNMETGINGTSGQAQILFPDGNLRQDSTSGRINCNLAQVAALSGSWQSGLRTGTVANNTWYAIYAVKTTDDTAKFVAVADTVLPLQTNFATLNSNFGTNGWVYLGMIRYGDSKGTANAILSFLQAGSVTIFRNTISGAARGCQGLELTSSASASSLTYSYTTGTSGTAIPNHITIGFVGFAMASVAANVSYNLQTTTNIFLGYVGNATSSPLAGGIMSYLTDGFIAAVGSGTAAMDIFLSGYVDGVLGVGSNPIL